MSMSDVDEHGMDTIIDEVNGDNELDGSQDENSILDDDVLNGSEKDATETIDDINGSEGDAQEGGLAGLDDDDEEDDEFTEIDGIGDCSIGEEVEEEGNKKRAISPVTWDVDVHVNDNISDDSPIHSDASVSDAEDDQKDAGERKSGDDQKSNKAKSVSNTQMTSQLTKEQADALRPRVHKYLFREAKYFMVKSSNHENVRLAKAKSVWSTPPQNEFKFNKAVEENTTVILIFSVKESGAFQGFARMKGASLKDGPKIAWVLPPGISARALSGVFELDWISRTDLQFTETGHLRNPWNMNKPVKIARDGQEIEPRIGEQLCKLFSLDGSSDYERVISRVKRKRESLLATGPIRKNSHRSYPSDSGNHHPGHRGDSRTHGRLGLQSASSRARSSNYPPRNGAARPYPPSHHPPPPGYPPHGYNRNSGNSHRNSYPPAPYGGYGHSGMPPALPDLLVKGSYEDYLSEVSRRSAYLPGYGGMPAPDPYHSLYPPSHMSQRDAPPPPPIPSYTSSRDRDRDRTRGRDRERDRDYNDDRSRGHRRTPDRYERDVENFLRKTANSSRYYSSRSSSDTRYKESSSSRDYRRERSRSRERYRSHHR